MNHSIVIPAYNEESRIEATARDYASYVEGHYPAGDAEVLIVVNGSRDRTGEIARELESEIPCVRAWETEERLGKGGAVIRGFELAEGAVVAFTDADNATVPAELRKLLDAVDGGADAAIGSRWLPESVQAIPQPFGRRVASRVFNLITRILFLMPFKDTQCGAKAFKREAIMAVRGRLQSTGWAFDVELLWRLTQDRYTIEEIPIVWRDNSHSRIRMHKDAPSMLLDLVKLRLRG